MQTVIIVDMRDRRLLLEHAHRFFLVHTAEDAPWTAEVVPRVLDLDVVDKHNVSSRPLELDAVVPQRFFEVLHHFIRHALSGRLPDGCLLRVLVVTVVQPLVCSMHVIEEDCFARLLIDTDARDWADLATQAPIWLPLKVVMARSVGVLLRLLSRLTLERRLPARSQVGLNIIGVRQHSNRRDLFLVQAPDEFWFLAGHLAVDDVGQDDWRLTIHLRWILAEEEDGARDLGAVNELVVERDDPALGIVGREYVTHHWSPIGEVSREEVLLVVEGLAEVVEFLGCIDVEASKQESAELVEEIFHSLNVVLQPDVPVTSSIPVRRKDQREDLSVEDLLLRNTYGLQTGWKNDWLNGRYVRHLEFRLKIATKQVPVAYFHGFLLYLTRFILID